MKTGVTFEAIGPEVGQLLEALLDAAQQHASRAVALQRGNGRLRYDLEMQRLWDETLDRENRHLRQEQRRTRGPEFEAAPRF